MQPFERLKDFQGTWPADAAIAAPDPSPHDAVLGWPFRNLVALLATMFAGEVVTLVGLRSVMGTVDLRQSWRVAVQLPESCFGADGGCPRVAGWEAVPGKVRLSKLSLFDLSAAARELRWD